MPDDKPASFEDFYRHPIGSTPEDEPTLATLLLAQMREEGFSWDHTPFLMTCYRHEDHLDTSSPLDLDLESPEQMTPCLRALAEGLRANLHRLGPPPNESPIEMVAVVVEAFIGVRRNSEVTDGTVRAAGDVPADDEGRIVYGVTLGGGYVQSMLLRRRNQVLQFSEEMIEHEAQAPAGVVVGQSTYHAPLTPEERGLLAEVMTMLNGRRGHS